MYVTFVFLFLFYRFFFFQAEDGIRDLVRSRGLGDVYKRQENDGAANFGVQQIITIATDGAQFVFAIDLNGDGDVDVLSASFNAVSYTHLTLPTSDLV